LAMGVLLDTLVIRAILVPCVIVLLHKMSRQWRRKEGPPKGESLPLAQQLEPHIENQVPAKTLP